MPRLEASKKSKVYMSVLVKFCSHFISRCIKFTKEREELFELISSIVKYFTHLQDKQKLFWILNCGELDILNSHNRH